MLGGKRVVPPGVATHWPFVHAPLHGRLQPPQWTVLVHRVDARVPAQHLAGCRAAADAAVADRARRAGGAARTAVERVAQGVHAGAARALSLAGRRRSPGRSCCCTPDRRRTPSSSCRSGSRRTRRRCRRRRAGRRCTGTARPGRSGRHRKRCRRCRSSAGRRSGPCSPDPHFVWPVAQPATVPPLPPFPVPLVPPRPVSPISPRPAQPKRPTTTRTDQSAKLCPRKAMLRISNDRSSFSHSAIIKVPADAKNDHPQRAIRPSTRLFWAWMNARDVHHTYISRR